MKRKIRPRLIGFWLVLDFVQGHRLLLARGRLQKLGGQFFWPHQVD